MPSRPIQFLQANINHCAIAQDLLCQSMAEWNIGMAIVAEPYFVPPTSRWVGSTDGLAAILVAVGRSAPPFTVKERGPGYVVVQWGRMVVVSTYFSPNRSRVEFLAHLTALEGVVRRAVPLPVLIGGDLNAKSRLWGSPRTDARGGDVGSWALSLGLHIINRGSTPTCVRWQGTSIVDVTFATPSLANQIEDWRVEEDVETQSDHQYILFSVSTASPGAPIQAGPTVSAFPKWALTKLRPELAEEAALVRSWSDVPYHLAGDANGMAENFADDLRVVCRAAMPRAHACPRKGQVYWWTQELTELRIASRRARRSYLRCRRRARSTPDEEALCRQVFTEAQKALRKSICRAKEEARERFIALLDRDPWGRPYRMVRQKFKNDAPHTSTMERGLLDSVLRSLFPDPGLFQPPRMVNPQAAPMPQVLVPPVSDAEFDAARDRLRCKKTAPGPDGVPAKVLAIALRPLEERFRQLLNSCLETGRFPQRWKAGKLCLLRKDGRSPDSPDGYRPIVLLDDCGKFLEKILYYRIVEHLKTTGPDLAECQYGFRTGRSTVDAVAHLKRWTEVSTARGETVVAVSLDIRNAFNSLPHDCIVEALKFHRVPPYLCALVEDYLMNRRVLYEGPDGHIHTWPMAAGVPQGSVLGPLLWNLGYNWVLRGNLLPRMEIVCFADDTLIAASAMTGEEAARLASVGTYLVVQRIRLLGLEVALNKTRAMTFHAPRRRNPTGLRIRVEGATIPVDGSFKYLGLVLDPRWSFKEHFKLLTPRLCAAAAGLSRLLPNLGGPSSLCRRLYHGVIRSMALYGAPVWAECINSRTKALLRQPQRAIAIRAIRAYRTVSHGAACVLAGTIPWDIDALVLSQMHQYRVAARLRGDRPALDEIQRVRTLAQREALRQWKEALAFPTAGHRTIEAICPVLEEWVGRRQGSLSFRIVQVLTGHGCFGHYLHKVARREETPQCHHCDALDDTAEHTLQECPAWRRQRVELIGALDIGGTLSLSTMVEAMLDSESAWKAVASFCDNVISQKEAAEREREEDVLAAPLRRRRMGRRRR
jgi:hypothetical protein